MTLKSITDGLQDADPEEKGGKLTILDNLGTFLDNEQENNNENESNEPSEETKTFWNGFMNALNGGTDSLKKWLDENGF